MSIRVLHPPEQTRIPWAHYTVNFWRGCNMVSPECQGCYVKPDMSRKGLDFNVVRRTSDQLWRRPYALNAHAAQQGKCALVFTCNYSDFFHKAADRWRPKAWEIMRDCPNLIWLVLTKRPERITACLPVDWGAGGYPNVWLGVTVGARSSYPRLDELRAVPCSLRFISAEPLLESLAGIDLTGFSWILVGGMSGATWQENRMKIEWAAELHQRSRAVPNCAYFFKQASSYRSEWGIDALGRHLGGFKKGDPEVIRQMPDTVIPMLPLDIGKGRRFSDKEWEKYQPAP